MHSGRMGSFCALFTAGALLLALMPIESRAGEVDPFGFSEEDYSSWGIVDAPYPFEGYDKDGNYIGYGCFPVGNGLVFAHLGVDGDFNTLRGITGPGYQTRDEEGKPVWWQDGEWPDIEIHVVEMGAVIGIAESQLDAWQSQSVQQIRGVAAIKTTQRTNDCTLHALTYAVPDERLVVQEFALETKSLKHYYIAVSIRTQMQRDQNNSLTLIHGKQQMLIDGYGTWDDTQDGYIELEEEVISGTVFMPQARAGEPTVFIELTPYKGKTGYRYRGAMLISMFADGENPPRTYFRQQAYRQRVLASWQSWSSKNRQFDTGDQRLDDMLAQIPVIIETQRDAYSGGVSPLVSYHGYWVRDHNGPILTYLANGRFEEVMHMLRYHRAACLHYKHCWMQVPLDLDLSDLPGWQLDTGASTGRGEAMLRPNSVADQDDGRSMASPLQTLPSAGDLSHIGISPKDWEGVTVEQAEVPSWIVIQHYWFWKAMREAGRSEEADAFITEAWPFIAHNLFSMPVDPEFGVKFHGDETYTGGALYSTYDREESGAIGYPNGYIPTGFFSFDNTLLQHRAAGAAVSMANALGFDEDRARAETLLITVKQALAAFDEGNHWSPAVSAVTSQRWPSAFANICLRPFWLGIGKLSTGPPAGSTGIISKLHGPVTMSEHYSWTVDQLWRTPQPASTPWSGYNTGHSLGYWLSAATAQGDQSRAVVASQLLLDAASPEGAFCEILDADGRPVNIYGRINRVRPWESGINYHALVQYVDKQTGWLVMEPTIEEKSDSQIQSKQAPLLHAYPRPITEVLVLAADADYLERLALCDGTTNIDSEQIEVWDAGLPFSVADLYAAAVGPKNTIDLFRDFRGDPANDHIELPNRLQPRIPRLFIDAGVRGSFDRRVFKDHDFWYGAEMAQLLADYETLGGDVFYGDREGKETP